MGPEHLPLCGPAFEALREHPDWQGACSAVRIFGSVSEVLLPSIKKHIYINMGLDVDKHIHIHIRCINRSIYTCTCTYTYTNTSTEI